MNQVSEFSADFNQNLQRMKTILQADKSFDIVYRVVEIGGRKGCLFFIDGMTKDEVWLKILQVFQGIKPDAMPKDAHSFPSSAFPMEKLA